MITLHHANSRQRFREPSRHFGLRHRCFAKNRPQALEVSFRKQTEDQSRNQRRGRQQVTGSIHIPNNARCQCSCFARIEPGYGQPEDMRLHLASELRNQPVSFFRYHLRHCQRAGGLHQRCEEQTDDKWGQKSCLPFDDHLVYQIAGGRRQHQPRGAPNQHQQQPSMSRPMRGRTNSHSIGATLRKRSPEASSSDTCADGPNGVTEFS
jgi:hypothetical protein